MSRADTTVIVNWRDLYHPEAGGAEVYCEEVARRLAADGRRVVLLTAAVAGRPPTEHHDGYTVVRRGGRFTVYLRALLWLAAHRRRVDGVIDGQNGIPFFSPLVLRATTPVVLLVHHVHQAQFGEYFPAPVARFGRWLEGPVSRRVYGERTIVAVSPSTRRAVRRTLQLQGSIHVAVPGCRPVELAPGSLDGRSATPRIVCVGRLVRHKRIHLLLDAMPAVLRDHPDTQLHLVGDGPDRAAIEAVAAPLGRRVVFHGAVGSAERDRLVRSAWLAVNPTVGEGWGISVIEANAQGRPVIAFRAPGLRDSIRDGETGWLVDDPAELGDRIARSLTELADRDTAAQWSTRATTWAARADWDETARIVGNALEGERGRLTAPGRRRPTDLVTHVFIPAALIPTDWDATFRVVDRLVWTTSGLSLLLPGTDLADAVSALRRAGLPHSAIADPRLEIRIARPTDLVHPAAGAGLREAIRPEPPALTLMGERVEHGVVTATLEAPRAAVEPIVAAPAAPARPVPRWRRAAPVVAVAVAALLLRLAAITRSYELFVDEISYGNIARNIAGGAGLTLYGTPFTLHPPAFFGFDALVITVLGIHGSIDHVIMSLRPVSACFGALGCVGAYLLVGRVADRRVAFVAALVLALDPFVINYDSEVMIEAAAGAAAVATFGLLAGALHAPDARRRSRLVLAAGLMAAVVVTTKDTFGLVTVLGLLALLATGWAVERREALVVVETAVAGYVVHLIALAAIGDLPAWWSANIDGFLRLIGAHQQTGFNAPSVHVSLLSRAFADLSGTATSYVILAAGPVAAVAVVWVLRPWQPGWACRATARQRSALVVAAWALAAAAYLSYATLFGSIEEQMYYILLPPALVALATAAVTVRWQRAWLRTAGRVAVAATLVYSAGIWVHVHTTPSDGYNRFLAWESTHIPPGSVVSVTEGSAQFLLSDLVLGDWDTRAELVAHHVDDVVISTRLTDQGYEASVPFLDMLREQGTLIYSDHLPIGLQVYDVAALTGGT